MHQTVSVIFEDPGVQELLVKLYQKGINCTFYHFLGVGIQTNVIKFVFYAKKSTSHNSSFHLANN